jgi:hypothetical protein
MLLRYVGLHLCYGQARDRLTYIKNVTWFIPFWQADSLLERTASSAIEGTVRDTIARRLRKLPWEDLLMNLMDLFAISAVIRTQTLSSNQTLHSSLMI